MTKFSIDDLRKSVENAFAPVIIDVGNDNVALLPLLRISDANRTAALSALSKLDASDSGSEVEQLNSVSDAVTALLTAVADKPEKLNQATGDDLALKLEIVKLYTESLNPTMPDSSGS